MRRGLVAEFEEPEGAIEAVLRLRDVGVTRLDTYTPWPVKGMDEALALEEPTISRTVLLAGLCGAVVAYLIQWWTVAWDYPLIVGARPAHAWPAFILITFETLVLFAGVTAFVCAFTHNGLPQLWHPLFEVEGFERATVDRFFVAVDAEDEHFRPESLEPFLLAAGAVRVTAFGEALGRERPEEPRSFGT